MKTKEEIKERMKKWREANKSIIREKRKIYNKSEIGKEKVKKQARKRKLKQKYNISLEEYDELLLIQEHCCKICGEHQKDLKYTLHIDHCHKTNIIRGLLCDKCNHGLGLFNDNISLLQNAIEYLKLNKNE